jgi:hypothetical protein
MRFLGFPDPPSTICSRARVCVCVCVGGGCGCVCGCVCGWVGVQEVTGRGMVWRQELKELISSYQGLRETGRGGAICSTIIETARQCNLDKDVSLPEDPDTNALSLEERDTVIGKVYSKYAPYSSPTCASCLLLFCFVWNAAHLGFLLRFSFAFCGLGDSCR